MMAKGTYASINLATTDLDATFDAAAGQRRRGRPGADRSAVRGSRLRVPRSRGQHDPHPGAALSRPALAAMNADPRSRAQRRRDTEHRLTHDVDVWVASASAGGVPYLVPLSFRWDGETLLLRTPTDSPTGRNRFLGLSAHGR